MRRAALAPIAATVAAAALLTGAAVFTVTQAECDDPGRYVQRVGGGYELVGGCLEPGDLPVGPAVEVEADPRLDSPNPRP
jgi:hypothetical protein